MKKIFMAATVIIVTVNVTYASLPEQIKNSNKWNNENLVANVLSPRKQEPKNTFDFEKYELNQLPSGWSQYYSGSGGTNWKITNDKGNKVLAQLYSNNPNGHFNIVVNDNLIAKNMELSVRLKGVAGKHDQGGGFVWRFIDKNNYYVVRANPLEDNVVLYKVVDGKRSDLPLVGKGKTYGIAVEKLGNDWNTLKITVKNDLFTVYLNGKELFQVKDNTFPEEGKIGFWTKADAVTFFDDFKITTF